MSKELAILFFSTSLVDDLVLEPAVQIDTGMGRPVTSAPPDESRAKRV